MSIASIFSDIAKNAEDRFSINEMDYEIDGILYCHKCNTPKQCIIKAVPGVTPSRKVYCLCKCESEKRDRVEREATINALRNKCIPNTALHSHTFANDDGGSPEATAAAKEYVENFDKYFKENKGMLFFGTVGYGKTYMATCIANALIDKGRSCLLTDFPKISREWESVYGHKEEYLERLNANDVLIIDDLGVERQSEAMQEMVFSVLDSRLKLGRPMIITTNLSPDDFRYPSSQHLERIYSRLFEQSILCECKGADRRRKELRKTNQEFKEQLKIGNNH